MKHINPKSVYLISGRVEETKVGGRTGLSPDIQQRVVIADDDASAYGRLASNEPLFRPVGHTNLFDLEQAATKLCAAVSGEGTEWRVYRDAPSAA